MSKKKSERVVSFESDIKEHFTKKETFEAAHTMYEYLNKVCPGCSMSVLSMLISMLTLNYIKEEERRGEIFEYEEWYKYIMEAVTDAVNRYERKDTTVN